VFFCFYISAKIAIIHILGKTMKTEIIPEVSQQHLGHDTDVARLDLWREQTTGIPEVVLGTGKISGDIIDLQYKDTAVPEVDATFAEYPLPANGTSSASGPLPEQNRFERAAVTVRGSGCQ
jgi:hypothetical protein